MGIVKSLQALLMYAAGIYYMVIGEPLFGFLSFLIAVICDVGHIIEEKFVVHQEGRGNENLD